MHKRVTHKVLAFLSVASLVFASVPLVPTHAAQLTSRSVTLGSSAPLASTTHKFDFTIPASANLGSATFTYCTAASGTCNAPSGLDVDSVTISAQTGATGFSIDATTTTASVIGITRTAAAASGAVSYTFSSAVNPTATNTTFYIRIQTYTAANFTGAQDAGTVAASTAAQIQVTATVDETLTFCTGTSGITTSSCAGATGTSVSLGSLTPSTTGSGVSQIGISTNAGLGYNITVNGTTLTSGSNTITALATQTASTQGNSQFGINLRDNATPNVGTDPDGSGTATPTANYNTVDQYRFVTADQIASKASADNFRRYHVSYIANVAGSTPAGNYASILTYIATANF